MVLSVLSALARLDLDPWREAATLAGMPQQTATRRLTSLIETLPDRPPSRPEPETISTRLIALLPRAASPSVASSKTFTGPGPTQNSRGLVYAVLVSLLIMASMMGTQWAASNVHGTTKIDSAQASAAGAVPPQKSPQGSTR